MNPPTDLPPTGDRPPVLAYATPAPRRPRHRQWWGRAGLFVAGLAASFWATFHGLTVTGRLRGPVVSGDWIYSIRAHEAAYYGWVTVALITIAIGVAVAYWRVRRWGALAAGLIVGLLVVAGFTFVRWCEAAAR